MKEFRRFFRLKKNKDCLNLKNTIILNKQTEHLFILNVILLAFIDKT